MNRVTVIGGGVVGLSIAWALQKKGLDVTIVDAWEFGAAASSGNAGWVVPSLAGPVPAPGVIRNSARWLLNSESPLYIQPRLDVTFAKWLLKFWRSSSLRAYERGLAATYALSCESLGAFDQLRDDSVQFEMHDKGTLFVYRSHESMAEDERYFDRLVALGSESPLLLSKGEAINKEPSLGDDIVGAFLVPSDRLVRPESLVSGLVSALAAGGAVLLSGERVTGIEHHRGVVHSVTTSSRRLETDAVVIAAGVWSREIAKLVGVRIALEAGKGYSIDFSDSPVALNHAVYLHEDRVAISSFEGTLRIAGGMEFSGISDRLNHRRVRAIERAATSLLSSWPTSPVAPTRIWTGMRPMTPDGLPLIGLVPGFNNLTLATGHAMLGVTLAPITGIELANLMLTGVSSDLLRPFDPARRI